MNIIIPIAGSNKISTESEYIKSLQEIRRKTILQYVFEGIQEVDAENFIVIIKKEDRDTYHLDDIVKLLQPNAHVVVAEGETVGAACTCMLAVDSLSMDEPLLIVGGDQILTVSLQKILDYFMAQNYDGGVVIFDDIHPSWSYVRLSDNGLVIEASEKRPISRHAVAGVYFFKKAKYFFDSAQRMILKDANVGGKFFICPSYNEMILEQMAIGTYPIKKEEYYNFSRPSGAEEFRIYLENRKKGD